MKHIREGKAVQIDSALYLPGYDRTCILDGVQWEEWILVYPYRLSLLEVADIVKVAGFDTAELYGGNDGFLYICLVRYIK